MKAVRYEAPGDFAVTSLDDYGKALETLAGDPTAHKVVIVVPESWAVHHSPLKYISDDSQRPQSGTLPLSRDAFSGLHRH
jgi:hypothetical protein